MLFNLMVVPWLKYSKIEANVQENLLRWFFGQSWVLLFASFLFLLLFPFFLSQVHVWQALKLSQERLEARQFHFLRESQMTSDKF